MAESRWQISLDLKNDPELRERVEEVMRRERRKKKAELVRAAVESYIEAAELRLGIVRGAYPVGDEPVLKVAEAPPSPRGKGKVVSGARGGRRE